MVGVGEEAQAVTAEEAKEGSAGKAEGEAELAVRAVEVKEAKAGKEEGEVSGGKEGAGVSGVAEAAQTGWEGTANVEAAGWPRKEDQSARPKEELLTSSPSSEVVRAQVYTFWLNESV